MQQNPRLLRRIHSETVRNGVGNMAKRGSGKNGKKTVWTVLAVVSVLILIVCGVSIARQVIQIQQQRQLDGEMSQIARPSQDPSASAAGSRTCISRIRNSVYAGEKPAAIIAL